MRSLPLDILRKNLAMVYHKYASCYEDKYEMEAFNRVKKLIYKYIIYYLY